MRARTPHLLLPTCLALALLGTPLSAQFGRDSDAADDARSFSLPDTPAAKFLFERAQQHMQAARFEQALEDLQILVEDHREEVLPPTAGIQPVYPGALQAALSSLFTLPADTVEFYERRYGAKAEAALSDALSEADRGALVRIASTWPLASAAPRAWWALGDLELERGAGEVALSAWSRAVQYELFDLELPLATTADWDAAMERYRNRDGALAKSRLPRLEFARDVLLTAEVSDVHPWERSVYLAGPQEGAELRPSGTYEGWSEPFFHQSQGHPLPRLSDSLFPVYSAGIVYFTDTLELFAVDAGTGLVRWRSGRAPGWSALTSHDAEEFGVAVDTGQLLSSPAVSDGIVVAALHIPVSQLENADFRNIPITRKIPDRRLHAFDARTGQPLWSHLPPQDWDGETGTFEERMRCAGPPVIAAGRVLVPMYRMEGRIDLQVAAFDLHSGARVWSTRLISGQRELNMFGRQNLEFCAPPLRISQGSALCLTQLGSLARIDLFTGAIEWEVLYDQIPLPKSANFNRRARQEYWRNTPPVVADGTVIATPVDSTDLIAVDFESGQMLWELKGGERRRLLGGQVGKSLLIGADEDTVYVMNSRLVAGLRSPGGLRRSRPTDRRWLFEDESLASEHRPLLTAETLLVPLHTGWVEVSRSGGRRLSDPHPWNNTDPGMLLATEGAVFHLTGRRLMGSFEWSALLRDARSELARAPDDALAKTHLGRLLVSRAAVDLRSSRPHEAARGLREARHLLEPLVLGADDGVTAATADARDVLIEALGAEAQVLGANRDLGGARKALDLGLELATSEGAKRSLLLTWVALESVNRNSEDWSEVLQRLAERFGNTSIACRVEEGPGGAEALRLTPLPEFSDPNEGGQVRLAGELFALREQALCARRRAEPAPELEALHAILSRHFDRSLPGGLRAGEWAKEAIDQVLAGPGVAAYGPFEERATSLLDRLLSGRGRGDRVAADDLAELARIYPHSSAARRALSLRLEWAAQEGDASSVANIALANLPDAWTPDVGRDPELVGLMVLADVFGALGNDALQGGLYRELSAGRGDFVSPLPQHKGQTLQDLNAALSTQTVVWDVPAEFSTDVRPVQHWPGFFEPIGNLQGPADERLFLLRRESSVWALNARRPSETVWNLDLSRYPWPRRLARHRFGLAEDRLVLGFGDELIAIDASGALVWRVPETAADIEGIVVSSGVVLAQAGLPGGITELRAIDLSVGTPLWVLEVNDRVFQPLPLTSAGKAAFLPSPFLNSGPRYALRSLYTGCLATTFQVEGPSPKVTPLAGILQGDRLFVPSYRASRTPQRNYIGALDLERGRELWRTSIVAPNRERSRELSALVEYEGELFALLEQPGIEDQELELWGLGTDSGTPRNHSAAQIKRARARWLAPHRASGEVAGGALFQIVAGKRAQDPAELIYLQLPYGKRWSHELPATHDRIHTTMMPLPAVSNAGVAVLVPQRVELAGNRSQHSIELLLIDRKSGRLQQEIHLDEKLSSDLAIDAVGPGLVVCRKNQLTILE